jgi:hypothetical protein
MDSEANIEAKPGDKIQILQDGFHSQYVTLDESDIGNKYKDISLSLFYCGIFLNVVNCYRLVIGNTVIFVSSCIVQV